MQWTMILIQVLTFCAVSSAIFLLVSLFKGSERHAQRRFKAYTDHEGVELAQGSSELDSESAGWDEARSRAWDSVASRLVPNNEVERKSLQQQLIRAGIYSNSAMSNVEATKVLLMVSPMLACLLAGMTGMIDMLNGVLIGGVAAMLGMLLPRWWIHRLQKRRHAVIRRSLPDFLDLMICCLESGMGLQAALQRVSDELRIAHPELAAEMGIVEREAELGATVDLAMRHFAERSGLDCVRSLSTFMQQSQRFGTGIADALRSHAELLREQRERRAEEMAQKASVKILFPTLLCIFPAIFVVLAGPAVIQLQERFPNSSYTASN